MSASERLRALDTLAPVFPPGAEIAPEIRVNLQALSTVRNALPEIIAVVEKAEQRLSAKAELNALTAKLEKR